MVKSLFLSIDLLLVGNFCRDKDNSHCGKMAQQSLNESKHLNSKSKQTDTVKGQKFLLLETAFMSIDDSTSLSGLETIRASNRSRRITISPFNRKMTSNNQRRLPPQVMTYLQGISDDEEHCNRVHQLLVDYTELQNVPTQDHMVYVLTVFVGLLPQTAQEIDGILFAPRRRESQQGRVNGEINQGSEAQLSEQETKESQEDNEAPVALVQVQDGTSTSTLGSGDVSSVSNSLNISQDNSTLHGEAYVSSTTTERRDRGNRENPQNGI